MTTVEANIEQVEAGLREVTRAILAGADLDDAFAQWLLPDHLDVAMPLAVTFRHAAAAFRILVTAGVCPPRAVWVEEVRSRLLESYPPAAETDLDSLVLLVAAEAGGAALSSIRELPGDTDLDTVMLTASLLLLFAVLVEALMAHDMEFDDVFQALTLARRPAVAPDVQAAVEAISRVRLVRLM